MKKLIKEIATIQSGIYAKTDQWGDVTYLQAKYFNEKGKIVPWLHPDLHMEGKIEKHLLNDGDLLFAAKGVKNFTAIYNKGIGLAVASSTFLVLRLKPYYSNTVLPEYLKWLLNQPDNMSYLQSGAKGTGIPSISKSFIEKMRIDIPPIKTQHLILKVQELRNKEKEIQNQIEDLREKEIQITLRKAVKK